MASLAVWLTVVGIGAAGYAAEGGTNPFQVIPFAIPFALAVAAVAVVAWFVSGERRAALAFTASLLAFVLAVSALAFVVFWGSGEEVRIRLGIPRTQYLMSRHQILDMLARDVRESAIALVPAALAGAIAGGLLALARRRPGVAGAIAVVMLLAAGVSTPFLVGAATRLLLDWRSEGGLWNATSMSEGELAIMLGALSGSVVGAIVAGLVTRVARGHAQAHPTRAS